MNAIRCCLVMTVFAMGMHSHGASAVELPAGYYRMMAEKIETVLAAERPPASPAAMLTAAVLYTQQHPANPSYGDQQLLALALKIGDLVAESSERDESENRQDYEWEIHCWLDAYRLLDAKLDRPRTQRWRAAIERNVEYFVDRVRDHIDVPRYQIPFIVTSTNHYAIFSSTVYLAGRVLRNKEWEELGHRAMHRLASEEQAADGYWGEHTDNGPATGYDYFTLTCVALYWEHSHDTAALEALRRTTDFHGHFTWPNGAPVETVDGRNRIKRVMSWGHFGFSHWPDGRGYAEFLCDFLNADRMGFRDFGRIAQNALYYHEGPVEPARQTQDRFAFAMKSVPAGMRRARPWTICLSGLFDGPTPNRFILDRQSALSIYHDRLGLIISGANSKHQPELGTFSESVDGRVTTVPRSARLRMSESTDRLGLAHRRFSAELNVAPPEPEQIRFWFDILEQGRGNMGEVQLNLQLMLKHGEPLETAHSKHVLGADRIELGPDKIGGWIRHHGWTLHVDPAAKLDWPVFGFNPYRNGPETGLRLAVGRLSVPINLNHPASETLNWGSDKIAFSLETDE